MSAQFDFIAGLDISSLTSVTQAQFMQAINQLAPLSNIGGVITQAASSSAQTIAASSWATSGCPDVGNNPRFAKYVWLNSYTTTPIPFYYDTLSGNWIVAGLAAGSVTSTALKKTGIPIPAGATTTTIEHLISDINGNVVQEDAALANKLLVYDSNGKYITEISKSSVVSGSIIAPSQITAAGSNGNVLSIVGGSSIYSPINLDVAVSDPNSFTGKLPEQALKPGATGFLLASGASTPNWVSNNDAISSFLAAGNAIVGIALSKLKGEGVANDLVISNGTNITVVGQSLRIGTAAAISVSGTLGGPFTAVSQTIGHSLGVIPKLIRLVGVKIAGAAEGGWVIGNEVDISGFFRGTGNIVSISYGADSNFIYVGLVTGTDWEVQARAGGDVAIVPANWLIKAYAWA